MKTIKVYAIIVAFIFTVLHEIYKYLARNIFMLFLFKRYVLMYLSPLSGIGYCQKNTGPAT